MTLTVAAIDHVNLHVPEDGLDDLEAFYGDVLGFDIENRDLYEAGEKPFVSVRLTPTAVVHFQPTEGFSAPADAGYDHVALAIEEDVEAVAADLDAAGVEVEAEFDALGATGTTPTLYVRDPFGYRLELTQVE